MGKRLICAVLAAGLVFGSAGCGGGETPAAAGAGNAVVDVGTESGGAGDNASGGTGEEIADSSDVGSGSNSAGNVGVNGGNGTDNDINNGTSGGANGGANENSTANASNIASPSGAEQNGTVGGTDAPVSSAPPTTSVASTPSPSLTPSPAPSETPNTSPPSGGTSNGGAPAVSENAGTDSPGTAPAENAPPADYSKYEKFSSEFSGLFDTITVIVGYSESEAVFEEHSGIIYNRMDRLHKLFDIYNSYPGMNNLRTVNENAGIAPVTVERDIIDLLLFARQGCEITGGTVNVAMGPVLKIWHDYREGGEELPPMDKLREAMRNTDINDLIIDEASSTVFLRKQGMSLDVGAVAKAYAAEAAAKAAESAGMLSALVSAGGNITAVGKPFDGVRARWGIGIQDPELSVFGVQNIVDTVYLTDATVSCSGGYQRYYVVDGKVYNHVIDPATLMPAGLYSQVTVIHENSAMADLLSTALFILPQEQGARLAAGCSAEALWIDLDGGWKATDGYQRVSKTMGNYSAVD